MRPRAAATLLFLLLLTATLPAAAEPARSPLSWSAGGWLSAAWSGGWPQLDLRLRSGLLVHGGHELGLTAGLTTQRLASQLLYLSHYSHSWIGGRRWPVVSLWIGGATDLIGYLAQSRLVIGLSLGLRVPIGRNIALRVDLGHELLAGLYWTDRTFLAVGLELLRGPRWHQPRRGCYPRRRSAGAS